MADNDGQPAWLNAELDRLERVEGESLLAGVYGIARRFADEGDGDQHAEWLQTLMNTAWKQGRFDYELRAFGELRSLYESSGHYAYLKSTLLWYFKWLVERLPEHADVPLEAVERSFTEMEAFYRAAGESMRPYYSQRFQAALAMGYDADADRWYQKWQDEPAGTSDDCPACETDRRILYLIDRQQNDEAIEEAAGLIDGTEGCDETPATFARLMIPSLTAGRLDLSMWLYQVSVRYIRKSPNMFGVMSNHIVYLTMIGRYERASRLAKVGLAHAAVSANDLCKSMIYRGCAFHFAIAALVGRRTVGLARSIFVDADHPDGRVSTPDASQRCLLEARRVSDRLDARNGNRRYADRTDSVEEAIRQSVQIAQKRGGHAATSDDSGEVV